MGLVGKLARRAVERHGGEVSHVLERADGQDVAALLARAPVTASAAIVARLSPHLVTSVLAHLEPARAAEILANLPAEAAARYARRLDPDRREGILDAVEPRRARGIRRLLDYPDGTAGSLMDPEVLALPSASTAQEALQRVRETPHLARYNLYVLDEGQRLAGALNLRELLLARPTARLQDIMTRDPYRVPARSDRASLLAHPGWQVVHALPVVDGDGAFLGVIRYSVLRSLERSGRSGLDESDTANALGELFSTGARGVVDAFTAPRASDEGRS